MMSFMATGRRGARHNDAAGQRYDASFGLTGTHPGARVAAPMWPAGSETAGSRLRRAGMTRTGPDSPPTGLTMTDAALAPATGAPHPTRPPPIASPDADSSTYCGTT